MLSIVGLIAFLAASGGYDRLARAFFHIEHRLKSSPMKRSTVVVALLASLALVGTAETRDPCKTMMCMAGKAGLQGGSLADSDCSGAVSDFFSIVVKKKGKFKPEATAGPGRILEFLPRFGQKPRHHQPDNFNIRHETFGIKR